MTKKVLILVCGLIENLIFSGTIFGWPALFYMLKSEGIYEHLCNDIETQDQIRTTNETFFDRLSQTDDSLNDIDSNSSAIKRFSDIQEFLPTNTSLFNDIQVSL